MTTDPNDMIASLAKKSREALTQLACSDSEQRNQALRAAAQEIRKQKSILLEANKQDLQSARERNLTDAMMDRLTLDETRLEAIAKSLEAIAQLPDPLSRKLEEWDRPNGLHIRKMPVPLGVVGIIYESRPNVTADAGALCIKSGNAVILRGGSESYHSSQALLSCLHAGLQQANLPPDAVQAVPSTDRSLVGAMLQASGLIDVIIPRGGKGLTARVQQESRVPTILHLDGNCHSYLHHEADIEKSINVIVNAKMRRTGICGATESVLVDQSLADVSVTPLIDALMHAGVTEVRGDAICCALDERCKPGTEEDWGTEYLGPTISLKAVSGLEEAIRHINHYGSHHTDCILTEDAAAAVRFQHEVDSAIVMHNTSTQFADGGEFGMGAEIGISTGRLHARGPVGLEQLTTYKYAVSSHGAVRA